MGGLGHYFEQEGIPTTSISLFRFQSERMRTPRALWVPFELGRPLGAPDFPEFQKRVLRAALALLERTDGPVLEDFPDAAPQAPELEGWSCPVPRTAATAKAATLGETLAREVESLRPWYDLSVARRGRSTVGTSGLDIAGAAALVASYLVQGQPANPRPEMAPASLLKLASEDLKAYYLEAALAQPGTPSGNRLRDWLWGETMAGKALLSLRARLQDSDDKAMQTFVRLLLVPHDQAHRAP